MKVVLIEKSSARLKLNVYSDGLAVIESESFDDLYTLNFFLQTSLKKHVIEKELLVVHDKERNTVNFSIAWDENSFFVR